MPVTVSAASDFPRVVAVPAAGGAWTVAGGDSGRLVGEEDALLYVPAPGDRAQRGRAVEAAVDLGAAVAAPLPFHVRRVRPAVAAEQRVAHSMQLTGRRGRRARGCAAGPT